MSISKSQVVGYGSAAAGIAGVLLLLFLLLGGGSNSGRQTAVAPATATATATPSATATTLPEAKPTEASSRNTTPEPTLIPEPTNSPPSQAQSGPTTVPTSPPASPTAATLTPTKVPPTATPDPRNEPPSVVSIKPESGDVGVDPDANVVVTYSKPMDENGAASAIFVSSTAGALAGDISWNADDTVLTFDPAGHLPYGEKVMVTVSRSSIDKQGHAMQQGRGSTFEVAGLVTKTITLYSLGDKDGFVELVSGRRVARNGGQISVQGTTPVEKGFLTFDLSALPGDLVEITSGLLGIKKVGAPFENYRIPGLESVSYGDLGPEDFDLPGNTLDICQFACIPRSATATFNEPTSDGWYLANVIKLVQADWSFRSGRSELSQFRLAFGTCGHCTLQFYSGDEVSTSVRPYLKVSFTQVDKGPFARPDDSSR